MSGLFGFISKVRSKSEAERDLIKMASTLNYRPLHVNGTWKDETNGIYVGWFSPEGSVSRPLPLLNETGEIAVFFSGEDFCDPDTRTLLRDRGHQFNLAGYEYLPHLYEESSSFFTSLNGRFHGVLINKRNHQVIIFNDRYGMNRLYVYESKDAFYFSGHAKAILAVSPELRRMDPRGLGEYITCGCVLENRTLFTGLNLLPPGSTWRFVEGKLNQRQQYFRPEEWESQPVLDPESYYTELRDVFRRTLPRYFAGPNVGMSLTGGLDTRMILAWRNPDPGTLPCYTFGSMYGNPQDVILSERVADSCGQPFQVIRVGEDFIKSFADYAERTIYLTDGGTSVSHSPDLYVNELAAKIAPVRMTGNYGGEVLRRVRAFKPTDPLAGLFSHDLGAEFAAAKSTYARISETHPLSFAVFRQAPWHHYGLLSLEQTQLTLRSPYLDNELVRTVFRAPQEAVTGIDVCLRLIEEGNPKLRRIRTDFGRGGDLGRLTSLFATRYLTFTHKAEYAYDYGMPQAVAQIDHLLKPLRLERLFLARHKFYHFRVWYRDKLAAYLKQMLLDRTTLSRPYLQRQAVESMLRSHLKGNRNYTVAIHTVLTLELINRLLIDAAPGRQGIEDTPIGVESA